MRLVVSALNHDAHKAERLEFGERLRFARQNRELYTIWQVFALRVPADFVQFVYVGRNHSLDCVKRPTFARHDYLDAIVGHALGRGSVKRYLVHIDKVLPQRINVDLRPIGLGIGL
jgi:hypothetical protein